MLSVREREVLLRLEQAKDYLNLTDIAKLVNSSTRSVSRYIKSINEELKDEHIKIIFHHGKGYRIHSSNPQQIHEYLEALQVYGMTSIEKDILFSVLKAENITIESLSRKLNYSEPTIAKKISSIRNYIQSYGLDFKSTPYYGLSISGQEDNIREIIVDNGFEYYENQIRGVHEKIMEYQQFVKIKQSILHTLFSNSVVISDIDLNNLIVRVIVSIFRSKYTCLIKLEGYVPVKPHNLNMIKEILQKIASLNSQDFSIEEIRYIATTSGFMAYNFNEKKNINKNLYDFVELAIKEISTLTGHTLTKSPSFLEALSIHINILLHRSDYGTETINPMLQEIKQKYLIEMNDAILLAQMIEEKYKIKVSEDEIGYLAVHLGITHQKDNRKLRVVILCNYGLGTSQIIREKIQQDFQDLDVIAIYPLQYLDLALAQQSDLIISSVEIPDYHEDTPLIVIDNLLTDTLEQEIHQKIQTQEQKTHQSLSLMKESLFLHIRKKTKYDVLETMFSQIKKNLNIDSRVLEEVMRRETISSTDIGNLVAIPHTISKGHFESCIAIGILDEPIQWGKERVQLVMMIIFNQDDVESVDMFRSLYQYFNSVKKVNHLIESHSFSDFIEILKDQEN